MATSSCHRGKTEFPNPPRKRPGTDPAAWMTWDMLKWFANSVFDPFAACVDSKMPPGPCDLSGSGSGGPGTDFVTYVNSIKVSSGLRSWWRLGEGAPTYKQTASNPAGGGGFEDFTNFAGSATPPPTQDQTPGLLPPGVDDGAIAFNSESITATEFLEPSGAGASNVDFSPDHAMTFDAWIYPFGPSTRTHQGMLFGVLSPNFGPGDPLVGWCVEIAYVNGASSYAIGYRSNRLGGPNYYFQSATSAVSAQARHFVTMTRDASRNVTLYVDGLPVATGVDPASLMSVSSFFLQMIGNYPFRTDGVTAPYYGIVDEVQLWQTALSPTIISNLYRTTGAASPGWVLSTDGNCNWIWVPIDNTMIHSGTAPVNQVLTGDGSGGTTFAYPTIDVLVNGA